MKVTAILYEKAQLGWRCTITFRVVTANQFTDEYAEACDGASWRWLAYLRAMWQAKALHERMRAKVGEREAKGWAP